MMKARIALLLTVLLVSSLSGTPSKNLPLDTPLRSNGDGPNFLIDFSNFQGLDNQTYTEFYIQIGYNELQFIKNKGRFQAGYDIDFSILSENDEVIEHYTNSDVFEVDTYMETQSKSKARTFLLAYTFEHGWYNLKAILTDKETQHTSKIEQQFYVKPFPANELLMSDIQLSQKIRPAKAEEPYVKNQRYIEPNAGRIFAHGLSEGIYIYFEIYNLNFSCTNDSSTYTARYIFRNQKGATIWNVNRQHVKPGNTSAHSLKIPLEYFLNGDYILTVQVQDDANGQISEASKSFTVLDAPIALSEVDMGKIKY